MKFFVPHFENEAVPKRILLFNFFFFLFNGNKQKLNFGSSLGNANNVFSVKKSFTFLRKKVSKSIFFTQ